MKVMLEPGAHAPTRAFGTDAGLDIYAMYNAVIPAGGSARMVTGVHVELPPGTCGLLVSKSGLNVNSGITSTGLIDEGYTGAIIVKLYNQSDRTYTVHAGDKITQLVILPVVHEEVEIVDSIEGGDRGDAGFGSSGV